MSKFERDEIILNYNNLIKNSDTGSLIDRSISNIGPDVGVSLISMLLKRLGVGAVLGAASGPLAGAVFALTTIWTAWDLYSALTQEKIDFLLDKVEALDIPSKEEDPDLIDVIGKWKGGLQFLKTKLSPGKITQDPVEKFNLMSTKVDVLKKYIEFLKNMSDEWFDPDNGVKKRVKDWWIGLDPMRFEFALSSAKEEAEKNYSDLINKLNQSSQLVLDKIKEQKGGLDVVGVSREIHDLYNKLETIYGAGKIEYDEVEKQILNFVKGVLSGNPDPTDISKYSSSDILIRFRNILQSVFNKASKKIKSSRTISKRALKLPDGESINLTQPGHPSKVKDSNVEIIQKSINHINAVYKLGLSRLNLDGDYGPATSKALVYLMQKVPDNLGRPIVSQSGLSEDDFLNTKLVKQNPEALKVVANILSGIVEYIKSKGAGTQESTESNIIKFLRNNSVDFMGTKLSAYEYLNSRGYKTDQEKIQVAKNCFSGVRIQDWYVQSLVDYVENLKR